jgi:hypothetical protein
MLGKFAPGYAWRAVYGWSRNMWSSCFCQISGKNIYIFDEKILKYTSICRRISFLSGIEPRLINPQQPGLETL